MLPRTADNYWAYAKACLLREIDADADDRIENRHRSKIPRNRIAKRLRLRIEE